MRVKRSAGSTVGVPLAWFLSLLHVAAAQRWQVSSGSRELHWEDLNENISVNGRSTWRGDQTRSREVAQAA